MAKHQDPRWQLDLRPLMPGQANPAAPESTGPGLDEVVKILLDLQTSVDGLRSAVRHIGKRLGAVEHTMREVVASRESELDDGAVRPLRDAKPIRPIPPLRLEPLARPGSAGPSPVEEGGAAGA